MSKHVTMIQIGPEYCIRVGGEQKAFFRTAEEGGRRVGELKLSGVLNAVQYEEAKSHLAMLSQREREEESARQSRDNVRMKRIASNQLAQ